MAGDDDLTVAGGVDGTWARLEDLRMFAGRADRIGDELADVALDVGALATDADVLASAVLSPGTAARAAGQIADAVVRLGTSAARLTATGAGLRLVADGFQAMDRAAAIGTHMWEMHLAATMLGVGVPGTVLAAPAVFTHNLAAEAGDAVEAGFAGGWGAFRDAMATAPGDAGEETLGDITGFWSDVLLEMPQVTDGVVEGTGTVSSLLAGRWLSYEQTVVSALAVAGLFGRFDDTRTVEVEAVRMGEVEGLVRAQSMLPAGIEDLFSNQQAIMTAASPDSESSRLRLIEVPSADGSSWILQVPGTQEWGLASGRDPSDLTTNLHLTGPEHAALLDAIDVVLDEAEVGQDPIMVVGHSQGGIAAATFAAQADDRGRDVTHVVTGGSPVAHVDVPDDVEVLSLEHHNDPVPRLDGDPNPDRANWTTVHRDVGGAADFDDPIAPHAGDHYQQTGRLVDGSQDPSVRHFLESASGFFDGGGASGGEAVDSGRLRDYTIRRAGDE